MGPTAQELFANGNGKKSESTVIEELKSPISQKPTSPATQEGENDQSTNDKETQNNQNNQNNLNAEMIQALTPMFIAAIGGIIGVTVLVMHAPEAGFGLASTAIAGAAGLAQPNKKQSQ